MTTGGTQSNCYLELQIRMLLFSLNKNTLRYKNYGLAPFKNISVVIFGVMACRHLVSLYLLTHLSKL